KYKKKSSKKRRPLFLVGLVILFLAALTFLLFFTAINQSKPNKVLDIIQDIIPTPTPSPSPTPPPIPDSYVIPQKLHVFQSFNNCGPATLSMALSYMGVSKTQQELGDILRPYQVPGGDNDDKSVTLEEVAKEAEKYGLIS